MPRKSKRSPVTDNHNEDLTAEDLQKSLDQLQEFADEGDETSRKDLLLEKARQGLLDEDEREELFKALGGNSHGAPDATLASDIESNMAGNETLQKALDVSDFLAEQHGELVKSLGALADHQQQSDHRQHQFNLLLAKAVTDVGNLVKSMSDSVESIAGAPAAPRSRGANAPKPKVLNKSFAADPPSEEQLSKSEMMGGLQSLFEEVVEKSGNSRVGNVDLLHEISKFESTGMMNPGVEKTVRTRLMRQAH